MTSLEVSAMASREVHQEKSAKKGVTLRQKTSLWIISEDSPESYGPTGDRVRHLALASGSYFDSIMILTLHASRKGAEHSSIKSKVYVCSIDFLRGLPFPLSALFDPVKSLMFVAHGLRLNRSFKPTLIVGSMPSLEVGVSAWFLSRLLHAKLLIDLRDDWESSINTQLSRFFPRLLIKVVSKVATQVYSYASSMFVATQTIANTIRGRGIRTKTILVPNGADTNLFKPEGVDARNTIRLQYNLPIGKRIVVYSGSGVNPYYRLDLVLESLKLFPKSSARNLLFVFYVYNGQRDLEKLKEQLKIPDDKIKICSPIPRNRLAEVLSACDIGLVPFDSQSYLLCAKSTKMYEYLSCGLYVVSSGPQGGELDLFFQANSDLGSFTLPSPSNFVGVLLETTERAEVLLGDDSRGFRYRFVKSNFDRQTVMAKAAEALMTVATETERVACH